MKKIEYIKFIIISFLAFLSFFITLFFTIFDDQGYISTYVFENGKLSCFAAILVNIAFTIYCYNIDTWKKKIFAILLSIQIISFASYFIFNEDIYFLGVKARIYWFKKENEDYLKSFNNEKTKKHDKYSKINKIKPFEKADVKWISIDGNYNKLSLLVLDNNIYLSKIASTKMFQNKTFIIYSTQTLEKTRFAIKTRFDYSKIVILKKVAPNWYFLNLGRLPIAER